MTTGNNNHLIEGDFKDFTIRRILPEDYKKVIEHLRTYLVKDEITMRTLVMSEKSTDEFVQLATAVLKENYSFLAEEKNTKEVACLRLTYIEKQNLDIFKDVKVETRQMKVLQQLFVELDAIGKVFENYRVTECVYFFSASTAPIFRNQGLTREMYSRTVRFMKAEGHKICKVFTSSPYTGAATKTVGFTEIGRINYENMNDAEGNPSFNPSDLTPAHFCTIKVLNLDKL